MMKPAGVLLALLAVAGALRADDWPAFRGPLGDGSSAEKSAPTVWGPDKNVKWKAALPRPSNGSPIVSQGRVFVACPEDAKGARRSLYCFDRKDGKQLWVRTIEFGKAEQTHATNPFCGTTPAAEGGKVVVWHGSAGLHCYDFEGKALWSRDLGAFEHIWGDGTSPRIHDGKVILNSGPGAKIFVAAFDLATGKTLWETPEPFKGEESRNENGKFMGSWTTPLILSIDGRDQIVCSQSLRVVAYDPADGKILWWCDGLRFGKGDLAYASPTRVGDVLFATGGFNGPSLALRLGGAKGDVTATHRLWRTDSEKNPQSIGSGIAVGGHLYVPYEGPNSIDCVDVKTGKTLWREKLDAGAFWGSIVSAGGQLYVTGQKGTTIVFKPNPEKFELVAKNELGEKSNSTPAISDGEIFLRTAARLYCISGN